MEAATTEAPEAEGQVQDPPAEEATEPLAGDDDGAEPPTDESTEDTGGEGEDDSTEEAQLTLFAGGERPSESNLTLRSYNSEIGNELKMGDQVILRVAAKVDEVIFKPGRRIQKLTVVSLIQEEVNPTDDAQVALFDTDDGAGEDAVPPPPETEPEADTENDAPAEEAVEGEVTEPTGEADATTTTGESDDIAWADE